MKKKGSTSRTMFPVALSLALLGGLAAETATRPRAAQAEDYHRKIAEMARQAPTQIGEWRGRDEKVPTAAINLLKPNAIISRQYDNVTDGRSAGFLLVHCKDARDIHGHYPPNCYPAHGWHQASARAMDWSIEGTSIQGMEYEYESGHFGSAELIVDNFILTPGRYVRDMDAVYEQAGDYTKRFYGAGQVQVIFYDPSRWTEPQRREVFQSFISAYLPLIEMIRNGATHEP